MYGLTIIFLALLNGYDAQIIPMGIASGQGPFPTEQACEEAGKAAVAAMGPTLDAGLKTSGAGVFYGADIRCKLIAEGPKVPA